METRVVRLISKDNRYRRQPYKDYPQLREDWNTYITGQHIEPGNPETHGNLTKEQMLGQKPLTEEQQKKFPFVINPENPILETHMMSLVLTKDANGDYVMPRDKALYDYLRLQRHIAKSQAEFMKSIHLFYIEDELETAHVLTTKRDKIFKAQKLIREIESREKVLDIALLLNHKLESFDIDVERTNYDIIFNRILDVCESDPEVIESCFRKSAQEELFVAKLHRYRILTRRGGSYYDGDDFIGDGINGVISFMRTSSKENQAKYSRWSGLLRAKSEGKEFIPAPTTDEERIKLSRELKDDLTKRLAGYEEYMEKVMSFTRVDHLQGFATECDYPQEEWGTITDRKELRSYMLSKYKAIHNLT